MTLLIFILILSVLVLVHEFGHYITAKKLGIRVEEFGLGIPPRILSKRVGETLYSLNLLPFGGFVKVTGEDLETDGIDSAEASKMKMDPRSFASRSPGQRMLVLGAGVFMNVVLAVAVFYMVLSLSDFKTQYIPVLFEHKFKYGTERQVGTVVTAMLDESNAKLAGIEIGEVVTAIDDMQVNTVEDLRSALKGKVGNDVKVTLRDIGAGYLSEPRDIYMKPQADEEGNAILGVYLTKAVSIDYSQGYAKYFSGFLHAYNVVDFSTKTLGKLIGVSVETRNLAPVSQSVSGPVGIYELIGGLIEYGGARLWISLLDFVGLMSISLAFINILPLPALDGGRMLFVVIEKVKGSPLSPKLEAKLHQYGFLALLGLLLLVTIKDILR